MLVFYFYGCILMAEVIKLLFYALMFFAACCIAYRVYHYIKVMYILKNADRIDKIVLKKPAQRYRTVYEKTGYSSGYYHTTHYRAVRVPAPLIYTGKAYFISGRVMRLRLCEGSRVYKRLFEQAEVSSR